MKAAFCADKIDQSYGRRQILSGCTIRANRGECVGVAGRNGSGKSTLLTILAGARRPTGGTLFYDGRDLLAKGVPISRLIGYVPQTNPLIEELSARDNLRLLGGRAVDPADPVYEKLQLRELLNTRVSKLSGGMKRRLAIACALAEHPPVLIMDEPTSSLDLYHKAIIYDYLAAFRSEGGIVVMATHDIEEMEFCDRLYLISGGSAKECLPEQAVRIIKGGIT